MPPRAWSEGLITKTGVVGDVRDGPLFMSYYLLHFSPSFLPVPVVSFPFPPFVYFHLLSWLSFPFLPCVSFRAVPFYSLRFLSFPFLSIRCFPGPWGPIENYGLFFSVLTLGPN